MVVGEIDDGIGFTGIGETEEYEYIGVAVKGGPNDGFKCVGDSKWSW